MVLRVIKILLLISVSVAKTTSVFSQKLDVSVTKAVFNVLSPKSSHTLAGKSYKYSFFLSP